jgi:PIN domain nuclease of toxin-antitoxin system
MMLRAIADTHAVIWYIFDDKRLSDIARSTIEQAAADGDQIGFSSMTLAEIIYLSERGRIHSDTLGRLLRATDLANSVLVDVAFDRLVAVAMQQIDSTAVPELPDRVIAATAALHAVPIISRDHQITASGVVVIW